MIPVTTANWRDLTMPPYLCASGVGPNPLDCPYPGRYPYEQSFRHDAAIALQRDYRRWKFRNPWPVPGGGLVWVGVP